MSSKEMSRLLRILAGLLFSFIVFVVGAWALSPGWVATSLVWLSIIASLCTFASVTTLPSYADARNMTGLGVVTAVIMLVPAGLLWAEWSFLSALIYYLVGLFGYLTAASRAVR